MNPGVPAIATLNEPVLWVFLFGLVLTIVLLVCNVKGAILIGIVVSDCCRNSYGRYDDERHGQLFRSVRGSADDVL